MIDADMVELARRPDGTINEAMIVRIQQSRARRAAMARILARDQSLAGRAT